MIVYKKPKKKKISRYNVLIILMIIIFTTIIGKLVYLQLYKKEDYREVADTISNRIIVEKTPRGMIVDSGGEVLATNRQAYAITYTETKESNENFFKTMSELFNILESHGEAIGDDMLLKVDKEGGCYFEYKTTEKKNQNVEEIRFKRDRGLNEKIERELFGNIERELTDEEISKVNGELLKISPRETFDILVKSYNLIGLVRNNVKEYKDIEGKELTETLLKTYSLDEIRKYMLVKDTIKMQGFKGEKVVTLVQNVREETFLTIRQRLNDLPGIDIKVEPIRVYPNGTLASSILGYISPIDESQKDIYEMRGYDTSTDLVGKQGIEAAFEEELKGTKGGVNVKVNSKGTVTEERFKLEAIPGNTVQLSIDKDLQRVTEEALKDQMAWIRENASDNGKRYPNANRGAAIAIEVNTGRVLSFASYPDFDPNKFAVKGSLSNEEYKKYFSPDLESYGNELIKRTGLSKTVDELFPKDSNGVRQDPKDHYPKPFYNYGSLGLIPPGSIFKSLTTLAGLSEGVIDKNTVIYDSGVYDTNKELVGFAPTCHKKSGHGPVDAVKALQTSCNIFMYETGYRLYKNSGGDIKALDKIAEYGWKFGLGVDPNSNMKKGTGIEIEENFGNVYNFETSKNDIAYFSRFQLANDLDSGNYNNGTAYFIPFDYSYNDLDSDELNTAKKELKTKIYDRFDAIGKSGTMKTDEFSKHIRDDVKRIMDISPKYKENLTKYEEKNGKVNLNNEAKKVSDIIAKFVCNDKETEITSPAQIIYASIGQGTNNFTPLQLGGYISTLANGGTRYRLSLVDRVVDYEGNVIREFKPEVLDKIDIKKEHLDIVKEGMSKANDSDGGTAAAAFRGFPIKTAGKTGTADFLDDQAEWGREPFATYISFAPLENPEIAFIGVIYDGGHGGWTAPVARAVYEEYFKEKLMTEYPGYTSNSFEKYVKNKDNN